MRMRTCSASCTWGAWGACAGDVRPTPETCDNGVDENCNGTADEGCACNAVGPGFGGSFAVTGTIAKLVADPARCLVYGLRTGTPSEVVVFDTAAKAQVTRIALPQPATDLAISPSGARLLVAHDGVHQVSVIDRGLLAVTSTVPVASDPYVIELDDAGHAYYAELDQWCDLRSFDPAVGTSSDKLLSSWNAYAPDIELSRDGRYLFVGEAGISGGNLVRYRVDGGALVKEGQTTWDGGYGFPYPARHLFLSPGGQHVYYAGYQLDPMHLASVNGRTGERVFAEDRAGTFAVGQTSLWDAALVRPLSTFPATISAAALAADDTELWTWNASSARMSYVNVADLIGTSVLGERNLPPAPLSTYTLTRLVADPVRPLLYGLDSTHRLVVAIDTATLTPVGAIAVGASPSDLAISSSGAALYVGDLQTTAVARIDLATFRFDRFISTPDVPYEIEVLSAGRIAIIDQDQWTSVSILDERTGAVLYHGGSYYAGALAATSDGTALFVGEAGLSGSNIFRFDVTGATPKQVAKSNYSNGYGFPYPARSVVPTPDGHAVYYAGFVLDGTNLTGLLYSQSDAIRTISADGALATSSTKVYRVSDGLLVGTMPVSGAIQAAGRDGKTVYVYTSTGITRVDLSAY
jgi:YVTN family beta-propeller protein